MRRFEHPLSQVPQFTGLRFHTFPGGWWPARRGRRPRLRGPRGGAGTAGGRWRSGCTGPWPGRPCRWPGRTDHDRPGAVFLRARAPDDAGGALRAGGLPAVPVDGEHLGGVAAVAGLRGDVGEQRGEQGDAAGPGGEQQVRAGVAGIGGVLAGGQPGGGEHVVDGRGHRRVRHGGVGGGDAGDQVRCWRQAGHRVVVGCGAAGLAEVGLVAFPALAVLFGVPGIEIVRGRYPGSARREAMLAGLPPDHLLPLLTGAAVVLLDPGQPQRLDGGQAGQPRRSARRARRLQQVVAVLAVLHGQLLAADSSAGSRKSSARCP